MLALVVTVAPAAGVLTVAAAVAEGVDDTETFSAEAATVSGVCGTPGSPSACAGTANDKHPTAHTAAQVAKRETVPTRHKLCTHSLDYLMTNNAGIQRT